MEWFQLGGLTKLRSLFLRGDAITDEGLSHLTGLCELRRLYCGPTVSRAGINKYVPWLSRDRDAVDSPAKQRPSSNNVAPHANNDKKDAQ